MIVSAAFCPHPPLLVPGLAGRVDAELERLRDACRSAVRDISDVPHDALVLLGSGASSTVHSPLARGSLAGFGLDLEVHLGSPSCGGTVELPLSLTVGAWLVGDVLGPRSGARGFTVGPDFADSRAALELLALAEPARVALLVMGDGSARRGATAPGYLDERAAGFDAEVEKALRTGDGAALEALDPVLGAHLLAEGVTAWRVAGSLLDGGRFSATVQYSDDPYGVAYFVATWLPEAPE